MKLKEKDAPDLQLRECFKAAGVDASPKSLRTSNDAGGDGAAWDIVRAGIGEETAGGAALVSVPAHRNGSTGSRGREQRIGGFYEIEFDEPVVLKQPALGHSCHFGLGLFVPAAKP
jgi:hypothetical protein